jgi:hypothetical protein
MRTYSSGDVNVQDEVGADEHYIGPRNRRPVRPYHVGRDCHESHYVLIRLAQDSDAPIWVGRGMCNPMINVGDSNYQRIQIQ